MNTSKISFNILLLSVALLLLEATRATTETPPANAPARRLIVGQPVNSGYCYSKPRISVAACIGARLLASKMMLNYNYYSFQVFPSSQFPP